MALAAGRWRWQRGDQAAAALGEVSPPPPPTAAALRPNADLSSPSVFSAPLPSNRYCFWTMVQLVASPKTAFRHASYHKQTKNHWARDDPAFAVALCGLVAAAAAAYCLA